MSERDTIRIRGARTQSENIDVTLPRNKLIVMTGLSQEKAQLAFDTIYEGQRRYVESLSSYARQFLGQMDKPDVDSIEGLSPAISIDQKTTSRNPPFHGGHGDGNSRLPAFALRARGRAPLPRVRQGNLAANGGSNRGSGFEASNARVSSSWRRLCGRARANIPSSSRIAAKPGLQCALHR